ncbi:MAG: ATP-binding cassette domain-containing protein [Defluviitaleaceae bacterium]|nr:ATP-binding cassette domain-containing protein [Defluviitaleaceae bacterium]
MITGKNGVGKSLLLTQLHTSGAYTTVLISQSNDEMINSLTPLENISLTIENKKNLDVIKSLLNHFNMAYLLDANVKKLSGGEKRILSLIRGLLSDAPLILIDEPTNDLDFNKVDLLLDLLEQFCQTKTFMIVTHDDRLHKLAVNHYHIENQQLLKVKEHTSHDEMFSFSNEVQHAPNQISKLFSINLLTPLLLMTTSIFILFMMQDAKETYVDKIAPISYHQVDLFSPFTIFQDNITGALPLSIFELIKDDAIPSYRDIRAYVETFSSRAFTFTLEIEESDDYIIYPIEYFKIGERAKFYPLEIYITDILNQESGSVFIDTSKIFTGIWDDIMEDMLIYQLDQQLYLEASNMLYERYHEVLDPLKLTYAVLILNEDIDFWDFLQSDQIVQLSEGHYFIRSNETIQLINQAIVFDANTAMRNYSLFLGVFVLIVNTIYSFLYVQVHKKRISVLQHYGFSHGEIINAVKQKFNFKWMPLTFTLIVILTNIFAILNDEIASYIVSYLPAVLVSLAILISHYLNKRIIGYQVKYLGRWHTR